MPLAWAARQVFTGEKLDEANKFSPLFRQDREHLHDDDLLKNLAELHRAATANAKPKLQAVPGQFVASIQPYPEGCTQANTLTPSLLRVRPYDTTRAALRREVYCFPRGIILSPYASYVHFLYVYPRSLLLNNKQSSFKRARNILVRVQLMESDKTGLWELGEGLRCIYGKAGGSALTTQAYAAVSHHTSSPGFYEEVKIELPVNLTEHHHIFFTFYHVAVASSKGDKHGRRETPLGFAFLPVLPDGVHQINGTFDLQVAHAETRYDQFVLPAFYTRSQDLPNAPAKGPMLRWLDKGRPLFSVTCRTHSTILADDDHLRNFFRICQESDWGRISDKELLDAVKALHALKTETMIHHLPVLFNVLFRCLPAPPPESEVPRNIIKFLVFAVSEITKVGQSVKDKDPGRTMILQYIYHTFDTPHQPTSRTVHSELVRGILQLRADEQVLKPKFLDELNHNLWFFLQIINKSMAQHLYNEGNLSAPRQARFSKV